MREVKMHRKNFGTLDHEAAKGLIEEIVKRGEQPPYRQYRRTLGELIRRNANAREIASETPKVVPILLEHEDDKVRNSNGEKIVLLRSSIKMNANKLIDLVEMRARHDDRVDHAVIGEMKKLIFPLIEKDPKAADEVVITLDKLRKVMGIEALARGTEQLWVFAAISPEAAYAGAKMMQRDLYLDDYQPLLM